LRERGNNLAEIEPNPDRNWEDALSALRNKFEAAKLGDPQAQPGAGRLAKGECLTSMQIGELAAGVMEEHEAAPLLKHVCVCADCGPLLREAIADLNRELTGEEQAATEGLASSNPEWPKKVAARVTPMPPRSRLWAWGALAAALVIGVPAAWWLSPNLRGGRSERLLTEAYKSGRPFEFRLSLNGYGALNQTAGGTGPQSIPLMQAQADLASARRTSPNDPGLLRLCGIAEILDRNPDAAVSDLKRRSDLFPAETDSKTDLAAAYALRAETEQRPSDYGAALELLSETLRVKPDSLPALFNIALVSERLGAYTEALEYWNRYLALDSKSPWSAEARRHIQDLEQKKNSTTPR
jgi:tetratricopeptide (TPR) repeat protein